MYIPHFSSVLMKGVKDQIKVNREEEKRRMDQEDKFNQERKRLMALTPPNERRKKKTRATESRDVTTTQVDWSTEDEWDADEYNDEDDIWEESLNLSEGFVDSRSVTPVPDRATKGSRNSISKVALPGIKTNHSLLSKSQRQLSTPVSTNGKRKQQKRSKPSILESQKIYREKFQRDSLSQEYDSQHGAGAKNEQDARSKKPQRLLPLAGRSAEFPVCGPASRGDRAVRGRSVDSWSGLATPSSTLPSAMFTQSLDLRGRKGQKLEPLREKRDTVEEM